jgi:hypothetical protein
MLLVSGFVRIVALAPFEWSDPTCIPTMYMGGIGHDAGTWQQPALLRVHDRTGIGA